MENLKASIVIANFNGKVLLEKNLPSVIEAVQFDEGEHEIIVIDDGSKDDSREFIKKNFPQIKLIELGEQKGTIAVHNTGIKESQNDMIVFLDNDVEVKKDFLHPLLNHFKDKRIFAVNSRMLPGNNRNFAGGGRMGAIFKWGFVWDHLDVDNGKIDAITQAFCVSTGGSAFSRIKLLELGGFDELFRPLYWDDADLSYRAWKRGWISLYEPKSVVYHSYGETMNKILAAGSREFIHRRNTFLFIWKNISDKSLLLKHFFFLPFFLIIALFTGRPYFTISFFASLGRLKDCLKKRALAKKRARLSDKEVFKLLSQPDYFRKIYLGDN